MKKLTVVLISLLVASLAQGQSLANTVDLSEQTFTVPVDLSTAKVKVTTLGYGAPTLKVLIPELAAITVLDHRNLGEEAPCMANFEAFTVDAVVQGNPAVVETDITVRRQKVLTPIEEENTCRVHLTELVTTEIRGLSFSHFESQKLPDRHIDDCI